MINYRWNFKAVGRVLKDSWQRKNKYNSHTLQNFRRACKIHGSFRMGCENFARDAKISHTLRTNFSHPVNQFRTLCKNKLTLRTHFAHSAKFS